MILSMVFAATTVYEAAFVQPYRVSTTTATSTSTSTVTVHAVTDQVAAIYASHLLSFGSRNASELAGQYEENASLLWIGRIEGLQGNYTGQDIHTLYAYWTAHSLVLYVTNESQPKMQVEATGGGNSAESVTVNSTFIFGGESTIVGAFNGTVAAETVYVRLGPGDSSASWLISQETWDFLSYWEQYPLVT